MSHDSSQVLDAIKDLITSYHELNSSCIDELTEEPSPLEFMRFVAKNRPFVVRGGAKSWKAVQRWNASYLQAKMGNQDVVVAVTPHGNADSVARFEDGTLCLVKPHETSEPFSHVLKEIQAAELNNIASPVKYLQTQNDNLRNEYSPLLSDCLHSVPFARIALQRPPDAINFWLGNSHSVTALHKDNYENIYVQVIGRKHFVLLPPVEAACVNERECLNATFVRREGVRAADEAVGGDLQEEFDVIPDGHGDTVPFPTWDPDKPDTNASALSGLSRPLRVTLDPGDMLYLPAMWYHKVSQSCSDEGICCAVNYWYDMDFDGSLYSMCSFARKVGFFASGSQSEPPR